MRFYSPRESPKEETRLTDGEAGRENGVGEGQLLMAGMTGLGTTSASRSMTAFGSQTGS